MRTWAQSSNQCWGSGYKSICRVRIVFHGSGSRSEPIPLSSNPPSLLIFHNSPLAPCTSPLLTHPPPLTSSSFIPYLTPPPAHHISPPSPLLFHLTSFIPPLLSLLLIPYPCSPTPQICFPTLSHTPHHR